MASLSGGLGLVATDLCGVGGIKKHCCTPPCFFHIFKLGHQLLNQRFLGRAARNLFHRACPLCLLLATACHCSLQMQCPDRCVPTGPASAGRLRLRIRGEREPALFGDATCGVRAGPYKCNLDSSPTTRCGTPLLQMCPRVPASPVPTLRQNASQHSTA